MSTTAYLKWLHEVELKDLPTVGVDDKLQHFVGYAVLSAGAVQLFVRRLSWGRAEWRCRPDRWSRSYQFHS